MMLDLKADGRIKLIIGDQLATIEALRDQLEELTAQLADRDRQLADKDAQIGQLTEQSDRLKAQLTEAESKLWMHNNAEQPSTGEPRV